MMLKELALAKTIACLKFGIDNLENVPKTTIRNKITNHITNQINRIHSKNQNEELLKNYRITDWGTTTIIINMKQNSKLWLTMKTLKETKRNRMFNL